MADRPALPYRVGTYSTFLARMLSSLDRQAIPDGPNQGVTPLRGVNAESSGDFITALLQGWAAVGDVLTFYQERIANECYLGPATEHRSVLELAQGIGYQPSPGIAASTYLAFTVAEAPGSPERVVVPQGTPVQSIPTQGGQLPQTFETSHQIEARAEWNSLKPYIPWKVVRQQISGRTNRVRLRGLTTALNPGDPVLVLGDSTGDSVQTPEEESKEGFHWLLRILKTVEPNPEKGYTLVTWEPDQSSDAERGPLLNPRVFALRRRLTLFGHDAPDWSSVPENVKLRYSPRRGGLLLSSDGGVSWQPVDNELPEQPVRALVMDAAGTIFAGVAGSGVFRSGDQGQNWEPASAGLTSLEVNALAIDERGHLIAGTANGVFRSADGGNQWEGIRGEFRIRRLPFLDPLDTGLPATATRSLGAFTDPDHDRSYLIIGTDRGIFRSVSGDSGWRAVNRGLPHREGENGEASITVFALARDSRSQELLAGTDYGVFRSTNRGGRWRPVNTGLPGADPDSKLAPVSIRALAAVPREASDKALLFAGTDYGVFRWDDAGEQWQPVNQGLPEIDPGTGLSSVHVHSLVAHIYEGSPQPTLFAGTDQGLFRSDDQGLSWSEVTPDLLDREVQAVAIGPRGELAMATPVTGVAEPEWPHFHARGNQLDLDTSQPRILPGSWLVLRERLAGQPPLTRLYQVGSAIVLPRQDFGLNGMVTRVEVEPDARLGDFGLRRTEVLAQSEPLELFSEEVLNVETLSGEAIRLSGLVPDLRPGQAISVTGNAMKVRTGDLGGVFRLAGPTWQEMGLANQDVRALVINRDGEVFAGTRNGGVFIYSSYRQRWRPRNTRLATRDVRALVMNSSGWLFAGTRGGGVFRSSDQGDYWTQVNEGLSQLEVNALAVSASDRLFAGTKMGVFRSTDDGNSWSQVSAGLPDDNGADVRALAVDGRGWLYAGTRGGGVFRSTDHGDTWVSVSAGLSNRDVRALAMDAYGNLLAGTAGGGVFFLAPGAERWSSMNDFLSVKDVRALAVSPNGEIFSGTRGGGVFRCGGVLMRWEQMETGVSSDVRALACAHTWGPRLTGEGRRGDGQYLVVAGTRDVALLTSSSGLESLELRQRLLFSVGRELAADLDQGAIPEQIASGFEDLLIPLSKEASVAVKEEGASWAIEDAGNKVYPLRNEQGSLNVYQLPEPLQVVTAPQAVGDGPPVIRWQLMDRRLGFRGAMAARAGELTLVADSAATDRVSEVAHIQAAEVVVEGDYTALVLSNPLQYVYDPRTVVISANLAHATHGKTVEQEVLGSGEGGQAHQSFVLNHWPLTYTEAETSRGGQSTLQVRMVSEAQPGILPGVPLVGVSLEEGVPWEEAPSLFGSQGSDLHYITRVDAEGRTRIIFGDGNKGARLPTGTENVVATYRYGIGREGQVVANSLTLLQRQPLGITGVTNPVPAVGGVDAEPMETARIKAPVATRPLGRIVSIRDYEDFIYGLPGVGKVQVKPLWNGQTRLAHVTVAAAGGAPVERGSALYASIVQAVQANRASPHHQVEIDSADILHFNLAARVYVSPNFPREAVAAAIKEALTWTFSFDNREFGKEVAASDVTSLIQQVPGVQHVDLKAFYTVGSSASVEPYLSAYTATWSWVNNVALPAQLMLINARDGIDLTFETAT